DEDRGRRFDLSRPPLVRFTLIQLDRSSYTLLLSLHHILIDGWSFPVLIDELFALYASGGEEIGLPTVTPFREYLSWLAGRDRPAAERAWAGALAGLAEPTLLAPAPSGTPVAPEQATFEVPEEVTGRLTALARRRGWTLN